MLEKSLTIVSCFLHSIHFPAIYLSVISQIQLTAESLSVGQYTKFQVAFVFAGRSDPVALSVRIHYFVTKDRLKHKKAYSNAAATFHKDACTRYDVKYLYLNDG